ncbi:MAG: hypothetical protein LBF72_00140 [Holosporales bacterium]|jgi:hypothetical protein|nr:hypothetical protein [Holosporales bacterium]
MASVRYPVTKRVCSSSLEAQQRSVLMVREHSSITGLPTKSQTLLGRRATNSRTFCDMVCSAC